MTQSVLVRCPCCNTVLTVTVSCEQPDDQAKAHHPGIRLDPSEYQKRLEELEKKVKEQVDVLKTRGHVDANQFIGRVPTSKLNKEQAAQLEAYLYTVTEVNRLHEEINQCWCRDHPNGPCGDCQERRAVIDRLKRGESIEGQEEFPGWDKQKFQDACKREKNQGEEIHLDYEIARLKQQIGECNCDQLPQDVNGYCSECVGRFDKIHRLQQRQQLEKEKKVDKPAGLGIITCPQCKGTKGLPPQVDVSGTPMQDVPCSQCHGTGTVFQIDPNHGCPKGPGGLHKWTREDSVMGNYVRCKACNEEREV